MVCLPMRHVQFAHYECIKIVIFIKDIAIQVITSMGAYQKCH